MGVPRPPGPLRGRAELRRIRPPAKASKEPELLDRVFDPFFTTKPRGSGLGLALVHRIVEANEGTVSVESEPGRGTRFRLRLPAADRTGPEAPEGGAHRRRPEAPEPRADRTDSRAPAGATGGGEDGTDPDASEGARDGMDSDASEHAEERG